MAVGRGLNYLTLELELCNLKVGPCCIFLFAVPFSNANPF